MALVEQGRWAEAVPELETARRLLAVPPVLYNLGLAHRALGHNLAAIEAFGAYLAAAASTPHAPHQAEVEGYVRDLRAGVGHIQFQIAPVDAAVLLDGATPPSGVASIEVNPGEHVVAVTAPRFRAHQERVRVPPGGTIAVSVSLESAVVAQAGPPVGPIVVLGAGVLGLAAGGTFAIIRQVAFSAFIRQHCDAPDARGVYHCEPMQLASDQQPTDANYRLGVAMNTASIVTLIAGGVLAAGGATWLILSLRGRGHEERSRPTALRVAPLAGPGFVGLTGEF